VRTIVRGKHFEVPEAVRTYAERKLRRLERLVEEPADAIVELAVEPHRSASTSHRVDVSLLIHGRTIHGRAAALTHQAGIDEVVDRLERRASDAKQRRAARARSGEGKAAIEGRLAAERSAASEPPR
jgi:ribosomal subunit interface protein